MSTNFLLICVETKQRHKRQAFSSWCHILLFYHFIYPPDPAPTKPPTTTPTLHQRPHIFILFNIPRLSACSSSSPVGGARGIALFILFICTSPTTRSGSPNVACNGGSQWQHRGFRLGGGDGILPSRVDHHHR